MNTMEWDLDNPLQSEKLEKPDYGNYPQITHPHCGLFVYVFPASKLVSTSDRDIHLTRPADPQTRGQIRGFSITLKGWFRKTITDADFKDLNSPRNILGEEGESEICRNCKTIIAGRNGKIASFEVGNIARLEKGASIEM